MMNPFFPNDDPAARARIAGDREIIDIDLSEGANLPLDTSNEFKVISNRHGQVVILRKDLLNRPLRPEQAARLAAWLVAVADPECLLFDWILGDIS